MAETVAHISQEPHEHTMESVTDLDELITPAHKTIFLKYMQLNKDFIEYPSKFPKITQQLSKELNNLMSHESGKRTTMASSHWLSVMKDWIENIRLKQAEANTNRCSYSTEDLDLINLLDIKSEINLGVTEISCILDNLEFGRNTREIWEVIALQLKGFGAPNYRTELWMQAFNKWSVKITNKREVLEQLDMQDDEKREFFSSLENRLLDYLEIKICRICLVKGAVIVYNLYDTDTDGLSFTEKVHLCSSVEEIKSNDGFPQHICKECAELLSTAYKFRLICEESDAKLRAVDAYEIINSVREENIPQITEATQSTVEVDSPQNEYEQNELVDDAKADDDQEILEEEHFLIDVETSEEPDSRFDEEKYTIEKLDDNHEIEIINKSDSNSEDDQEDIKIIEIASVEMDLTSPKVIRTRATRKKELARENAAQEPELKTDNLHFENTDEEGVFRCNCGIVCFNGASLEKHIASHSISRPHKCTLCSGDFKTKFALKIHMRSHTGERPYVCTVCGKAFVQEWNFSYHKKIHTGEKDFQCDLCDYRARSGADLKVHYRSHENIRPYKCTKCVAAFKTSSNLHKHLRRHMGRNDKFSICGRSFKTWSALSTHRVVHSTNKIFACTKCSYQGNTQANLRVHTRTHTGIHPYACEHCDLKFTTASNRLKHVRSVHEQTKPHQCGDCGRCFFSKESARKHMVIHTGEKPYSCTRCAISYGWYNGLLKHVKSQHPGLKLPSEKNFLDKLM